MKAVTASRMWPLLAAHVALLAGAQWLEAVARHRAEAPLVIRVGDGSTLSETDGPDEDGLSAASGEPIDQRHADARSAGRRGELTRALESFAALVQQHPDQGALLAEYGYWLLAGGRDDDALAVLERATTLVPSDPVVLMNLGVALRRAKKPADAQRAFERAIAARPGYTPARIALAGLLRQTKRYDEAVAALGRATELGSNDEVARARVALGAVRVAQGKLDEAHRVFESAIERAPAMPELRLAIARSYFGADQPAATQRALAVAVRAAELAPDLVAVHALMGKIHDRRGDDLEARAAWERVLALDPENRYARRRLLRLALARDAFPEARQHAQRLLAEDPEEPEHHFLAGLVAAREGRVADAESAYRAAVARSREGYPEAHFNLGLLYKSADRLDDAIAAYRAAITARPAYLSAWNNLGLAHVAREAFVDGERAYRRALELDATYAPAWLNLGRLYLRQKDTARAIDAFEKALAARPGYPEAQQNLGTALSRAGRKPEAITVVRRLLEQEPRRPSAWFNLGLALGETNDAAGATAAFRRALELDPSHRGALRHLAQHALATGELSEAMRLYDELLDVIPGDRTARLGLATVALKRGDRGRCAELVGRVLAEEPTDEARALATQCATSGGGRSP